MLLLSNVGEDRWHVKILYDEVLGGADISSAVRYSIFVLLGADIALLPLREMIHLLRLSHVFFLCDNDKCPLDAEQQHSSDFFASLLFS